MADGFTERDPAVREVHQYRRDVRRILDEEDLDPEDRSDKLMEMVFALGLSDPPEVADMGWVEANSLHDAILDRLFPKAQGSGEP